MAAGFVHGLGAVALRNLFGGAIFVAGSQFLAAGQALMGAPSPRLDCLGAGALDLLLRSRTISRTSDYSYLPITPG